MWWKFHGMWYSYKPMRGTHKNKRIMMIMSLQNTTAVVWAISSNYKVFWKLIKSTYLITHFSWAGKLRVNMPFWSTSDMSFLCFILPKYFCCNLRHLVLTGLVSLQVARTTKYFYSTPQKGFSNNSELSHWIFTVSTFCKDPGMIR